MKQCKCEMMVSHYETEKIGNGEDIIKVKENFAKHEVFREFIDSMEYEKPYYLLLTRSVFTDGYSRHLKVDLKHREVTQQEKDLERAVRFYEAFQGYVYRHRSKYCQEGEYGRAMVGYMFDMRVTVPLGMDLNEVMEKLSEEWEQTFREEEKNER